MTQDRKLTLVLLGLIAVSAVGVPLLYTSLFTNGSSRAEFAVVRTYCEQDDGGLSPQECEPADVVGRPLASKITTASVWPPTEPVRGDWKRIQVGEAFTFEAPADTQPVALQGIDSAVGGYRNDRFNLSFDYGAYSNSLSEETPWTEIDGQKARIELGAGDCLVLPGDNQNWRFGGYVHVALKPVPDPLGLTMGGCAANEIALEELKRLYLSLRFNPKVATSKDQ